MKTKRETAKRRGRRRDPVKQREAVRQCRQRKAMKTKLFRAALDELRQRNANARAMISIYAPSVKIRTFVKLPYPSEYADKTHAPRTTRRAKAINEDERKERLREGDRKASARFHFRKKWDMKEEEKEAIFLRHQQVFLDRACEVLQKASCDNVKGLGLLHVATVVESLLAPEKEPEINVA